MVAGFGAATLANMLLPLLGVCAGVLANENVFPEEVAPLFPNMGPVLGAPKTELEDGIGAAGWLLNILLVLVVCEFVVVEKPPNVFFRAMSSSLPALLFSGSPFILAPWPFCENGLLTPVGV